jgi:hypothetical protein
LCKPWRIDKTWADGVHADTSLLQMRCPGAGEGANGGLGGVTRTVRRQPFAADNGSAADGGR